jgi:NADH:ubiquinone oxidoreductase subunit E
MSPQQLGSILAAHHHDPSNLLAILQDVQAVDGYTSQEAMAHVAADLNVPLTRIYSMATFYSAFRLEPRGKHHCGVCMGTACHVRGAPRLLDEVERQFEATPSHRSKRGELSVETLHCVGACAMGPLVVLDDQYHGNMTPRRLTSLLKRTIKPGAAR